MLPSNSNLSNADSDDQDQPEGLNRLSCKQLDCKTEVIVHTNVPLKEDEESANTPSPKTTRQVSKHKVQKKLRKNTRNGARKVLNLRSKNKPKENFCRKGLQSFANI